MASDWSPHVPRVSGLYERRSLTGYVWGVALVCSQGSDYATVVEPEWPLEAPAELSYGDVRSTWRPMSRRKRWAFRRKMRSMADTWVGLANARLWAESPGSASLQACVLVLLFAAAVLSERNDCAAYVLRTGDDVRGDGTNRAGTLYALGHEIDEDQHAVWRTPA